MRGIESMSDHCVVVDTSMLMRPKRKNHIAFLFANALWLLQQLIKPHVRMAAAAHAVVTSR
jgi:hypothetical protein